MKKFILILGCTTLFSFGLQKPQSEKMFKFEFTDGEIQTIYKWLGEAPAKEVEALRAKIAKVYMAQLDTTKKK